uniref:Uncharacterized protein n=1 Tax=Ovis aries TaxID=9940 RepID=A0AC11EGZ0_SHEEP
MALVGLPLVLLFLVGDSAASLNAQFSQHSEHRTPNCDQYKLPGCPRDFSPVCGSDMSTYPNECILCMKIRVNSLCHWKLLEAMISHYKKRLVGEQRGQHAMGNRDQRPTAGVQPRWIQGDSKVGGWSRRLWKNTYLITDI